MNTYIEYLGLNRLSTASTVWSLKNLFMVKTRVMKIKNLRELKNTCDGKHEGLFDESGLNHAQIKASTKIH